MEKGTTNGTVTDLDGNYTLTVQTANPVLLFSYVGYQKKELPVVGSVLNVTLEDDSQVLNEVVVTALGIRKKRKHFLIMCRKYLPVKLLVLKMPTL